MTDDKNSGADKRVGSSDVLAIALAALKRIAECEDAPDIDASGDWQRGLYCGVEDRDCRDRYEGADYGHAVGVEKGLEWASNEAKYALEQVANAALTGAADSTTGNGAA